MKKCPKCGAENSATSKFCTNCGSVLPETVAQDNDTVALDDETQIQKEPERKAPPAAPVSPAVDSQPTPSAPTPAHKKANKGGGGKVVVLIVLSILLAAAAGAGVYFWQKSKKHGSYSDSSSSKKEKVDEDSLALKEELNLAEVQDFPEYEEEIIEEEESPELIKYRKNFSSPDLTFCDAHGRISQMIVYEDGTGIGVYDFDTEGRLTNASSDYSSDNVTRDEKGRITQQLIPGVGFASYTWQRGIVTDVYHPEKGHSRNIYSDRGELRGVEVINQGNSHTDRFTDYEYDPYLNWIRRTRIAPDGTTYMQARRIVYY